MTSVSQAATATATASHFNERTLRIGDLISGLIEVVIWFRLLERDPQRRGVGRGRRHVLEDRAHARIEAVVVAGLRVEHREFIALPFPDVLAGKGQPCAAGARRET